MGYERIEEMIENALIYLYDDDAEERERVYDLISIDGCIDDEVEDWVENGVEYDEVLDTVASL